MSKAAGFIGKALGALFVLFILVMIVAGLFGDDPVYEAPASARPVDIRVLEEGNVNVGGSFRVINAVRRPDLMVSSEEFVFLPYTSSSNTPAEEVSFFVWFRARDLVRYEEQSARQALAEPSGFIEKRDDANDLFGGVTAEQVNWRKPVYAMRLN
ncbi:MAG: hypothetical protein AAGK01_05430 [Pseudomonadota bacterium]